MYSTALEYLPAIPELFLLSALCCVLVVDLFLNERQRDVTFLLSQLSLLVTLVLVVVFHSDSPRVIFANSFVADTMATVLKAFICLIVLGVFVYSRRYLIVRGLYRGEFFVLGLFGVLGMMILVSGHNLLSLYLGLELLSLSLYAMVAFDRDSARASEAAMKYFVLGALASGILLYGISILYGMSGTLDLIGLSEYLRREGTGNIGAVLALVFIVVALAFKLGAVPFHMWLPDVYHGSPTPVTVYIASASKIAGFAFVMRMLVEGLGPLHNDWQDMLIILVVLSLAIGNLVAIAQTNLKRMLAYSTIAHIGFLLLGILAGTRQGYSASMFYTIVYAITSLGAFGVVLLLSRVGFEADRLDDLKGLNDRSPWFAFIMLIIMFSMAGVPPTVGFFAKFYVLRAVIDVDLWWLAVVAVAFSVIGAFYYLRAVKMMYFDNPLDRSALEETSGMRIILSTNGLAVLALGIYPTALLTLCTRSLMW
ncbi:MAG: NADH-quinone oxidoreductase subunit NuoN [Gammaproteobacteria bacterium]|nr:NADH-quinone oxidoreductase subunit NuoN [Gammaproteobacteria bacterium]